MPPLAVVANNPTQPELVTPISYSILEEQFNIDININTQPLNLYSIDPTLIEYAKALRLYIELNIKFKENRKKGNVDEVYLINKKWYNIFKKHSLYNKMKYHFNNYAIYAEKSQTKKITFNPSISEIPPIDNNTLLIPMNTFLNDGDANNQFNKVLKPKLAYKKDFKEISKGMWNILYKYFKGDTPIIKPYSSHTDTPFKYQSIQIKLMFIPERQYISSKEYIETNIHEYIIYINDDEKSENICNHIQSIISADQNEHIKISMCNSNLELISMYKVQDAFDLQYVKQFLINNIENITSGKSLEIREIASKLNQPFIFSKTCFVQDNFKFLIEFNNNQLLFYTESISFQNPTSSTTVNEFHPYGYLPDGYSNGMGDYEINDFTFIEDEDLSHSPIDENNNLSGKVGLNNLGNTCFMNTGIQCLSNCELLTNYILSKTYIKHINETNPIGSHGDLIKAYAEVITHLWYGCKTVIGPYRFKKAISKFQEMFSGFSQHDTHEFLSFLLDGLHEDLNKVKNKPYITTQDENTNEFYEANKTWNIFKMRNQSLIVDVFYGLHRSMVYCQNPLCNYISTTFDPFSTLSLTVMSSSKEKGINCIFIFYDLTIKTFEFKMIINEEITEKAFRKKIHKLLGIGEYSFDIMIKASNEYDIIDPKKHYTIMNFINKRNPNIFLIQRPSFMTNEYDVDYTSIENKVKANIACILNNNEEEDEYTSHIIHDSIYLKENELGWIKVTLYQCIYNNAGSSFENISHCRNVYFNINWNNEEVYDCLFNYFMPILQEILLNQKTTNDNTNKENNNEINVPQDAQTIILNKIKQSLFKDLQLNTSPKSNNKTKGQNPHTNLNKLLACNYPFTLIYHQTRNCYRSKLSFDDKANQILRYDNKQFSLKNILSKNNINQSVYNEHEILFSIVWSQDYINIINNYLKPLSSQIDYNPSCKTEDPEIADLIQMLEAFVKKETLSEDNQWFCPKCCQEQTAEKKMDIYSCPEVLIIQLKRFKNQQKIETLVNFPIHQLDINNLVKKKDPSEITQYKYDLFAIANHVGGINGGHYYAYAKNWKLNKWFEYNDTYVSEIEESKLITKNAYVLFYCRKIERTQSQLEAFYNSEFKDIQLPKVVKQYMSANK